MISETLVEIALFYVLQFHDFWSSLLDSLLTKNPKHEQNLIIRSFISNPLALALYKFGLATLIPVISLYVIHSLLPIYIDTWIEGIVTINNILVLYKHAMERRNRSMGSKISSLSKGLGFNNVFIL